MGFGAGALVLVLSVFNGFEGLVKSLYSSFYPDVRITPANGRFLTLGPEQLRQLQQLPAVAAVSLVIQEKAHLQHGDYRTNAIIKGVDERYSSVSDVESYVVAGQFAIGQADKPGAVLGAGLEMALNFRPDRSLIPLTVYLPKRGISPEAGPLAAISTGTLYGTGTFAIQQEFDNNYLITHIDFLRAMLGLNPNEYSAVELKLTNVAQEEQVMAQLQQLLGSNYVIENRYQQNRSLFKVMRLEKWAIYAILTLLLIMAAFNMVGCITMLVLEKSQDIQVLQAIGASPAFIRRLFLTEGLLLATVGSVGGIALALLFAWGQVTFKWIPLQGSFVIDYYPVKVLPTDLLLVAVTVVVIALAASWLPAAGAARRSISLRGQ